MDKESIASLLTAENRYKLDNLPILEESVSKQVEKNTYDLHGNLALLKLYQFHPYKVNIEILKKILLKALMNLPNTDFLLCMYIIPEKIQIEDTVVAISTMAQNLETARFKEFWAEVTTKQAALVSSIPEGVTTKQATLVSSTPEEVTTKLATLVSSIPGFSESIRNYIIGVLSITYQTIPIEFLSEALCLSGDDLQNSIKQHGWVVNGKAVTFPLNDDNQAKSKKQTERNVNFEQLGKILTTIKS